MFNNVLNVLNSLSLWKYPTYTHIATQPSLKILHENMIILDKFEIYINIYFLRMCSAYSITDANVISAK